MTSECSKWTATVLVLIAGVAAGSGCATQGSTRSAGANALIAPSYARAGEGAFVGTPAGPVSVGLTANDPKHVDQARLASDTQPRYADTSSASATHAVSKDDVVKWSSRGTRDEIIVDRIERTSTVFHLTAADENQLRDAGVSETVIRAMKDTAHRE